MSNRLLTLWNCEPGAGRHQIAEQLAELWSAGGKTVLLVDVADCAQAKRREASAQEALVLTTRFKSLSPMLLRNYLSRPGDAYASIVLSDFVADPPLAAEVWPLLRRSFDWTLVLAPKDFSKSSMSLLDGSDSLIWIARPGANSIAQLKQGLNDLAGQHFPNSFSHVLLNRAPRFRSLTEILPGKPLLATLPEDQVPWIHLRDALRPLAMRLDSDAGLHRSEMATPASQATEKMVEDLRDRVQPQLLEALGQREASTGAVGQTEAALAQSTVESCVAAQVDPSLSREARGAIYTRLMEEVLGLGPLEPLLKDPQISEVMVNGRGCVYVEKQGKLHATGVTFASDSQLRTLIDRIVAPIGRRVDESMPLCDARLADGSRVNIVLPPLALDGPVITIRKFLARRLDFADLVAKDSMSAPMADFLTRAIVGRKNIIVSGGTGSGKTTLLNALSSAIPEDERIVTIEDAAELRLQKPHVVRLESRPPNAEGQGAIPIRQLVINSLRMRPDRIVVGECRGGEALDMLQAMNTGHDGSLTTLHANSPRDALGRLETLVLMAGMDLPLRVVREQIRGAIHFILQQARLADGSRKVTSITELTGMEGETLLTQELFRYVNGRFEATGIQSAHLEAGRRTNR